jgi:hypothetical protein
MLALCRVMVKYDKALECGGWCFISKDLGADDI